MLKKLLVGVALGALAGGAASAATWEEINNAGSQSRDWLVYGGDLGQMRYLPSDQINTDNVKNLKLKYIFQTGVVGSFENTPIVEGGVLYVTSPYNHLFAVDAATGHPALALRAQARHHRVLLRPEQPRRRGAWRPGDHGRPWTPCWWRSTRRPASWSGRPRSPTPSWATR